MTHPLEVGANEIIAFESTQLQRLLNRLLEIEVSQVGLPVTALVASDQVNVPDGGIDARIDAPSFPGNEFLPAGSSIWQVKAGKSSWPTYEDELDKEDVKQAILEGSTYMMVLGRDINSGQHNTQSEKLRNAIDQIKSGAPFELRSANHVAKWVTKYPAVWHLLGRPPRPFWSVRDFLAQQELHSVEYCWSDSTDSLRDTLRRQVIHPGTGGPLRVSGMTGVGKSRLVLETFAEPSSTAVYVPYAEQLSVEVLTWMRNRPGLSVTLVVDECSLSEAERLQTYASSAEGSLRLVTIGQDAPPDRLNHFAVDPMTDDVIREVVLGVHPQNTLDQREWIVDKARGFVKLARRLAEVARRTRIDLTELNVPQLLGEMFSNEEREALMVVALLSDVGWEGEHGVEGQTLSDHMQIEWKACRRVIERMEVRGYIGRRGRYRHVTPELLAIWFAAEEWRANRDGLLDIFNQASPEMADRMSRRFRQMPHVDEVADLAKDVLGPEGPFRTLAILNHRRNAKLFGDFSRVAPEAAIATLEGVFNQLDEVGIWSLNAGRREIVWTLERLVARRNLFPRAARLLLRLAVSENEHFANNSTGVFQSLFDPTAHATEANGDERLQLLAEVLGSEDERELHIAIGAVKGIFNVHGGFAVSADPGGEPPPTAWAPESWEERAAYCRKAFVLLENLLSHDSATVRTAAESALLDQFRSLFWLGLGEEALALAELPEIPENLKRRLVIKAEDVISYDQNKSFMTNALLAGLGALGATIYANPLRERLHLRLGSWNRDLYRASRESSESPLDLEAAEFKELVTELLRQPGILSDEFEWITSEEAVKGRQFLTFLAEQDRHRQWLEPVLDASLRRSRPELISSYALGLSLSGGSDEIDGLLDEWTDNKELQHLVPPVTATMGLTERRVVRLLALLDHGLDPKVLFCLEVARCKPDLSLDVLARLLRAMVGAGPPLTGTVWSILNHLLSYNTEVAWTSDPLFHDLLWELVGNSELVGLATDGHASYSWSECAKPLVEADPQRLVAAIVAAVHSERERLYEGAYVRDTLEACFQADPVGAWAAYAGAISNVTLGNWVLTTWGAEAGITALVGVDNLKQWIEESDDGDGHRVKLIAKLTTVEIELTPVIRWIVTEHGDSEEVLGKLMVQHGMRTFWGGLADAEQPRLDAAREWVQDTDPTIRKWAQRVVEDLEQRIERYRVEDEESELRQ